LYRAIWILAALALVFVGIVAAVARHIEPIARMRVIAVLESNFDSEVELRGLHISLGSAITVTGDGLVLRQRGRTNLPPLIEIAQFSASLNWIGMVFDPSHIHQVHLQGLSIHIPPKNQRLPVTDPEKQPRIIPFLVDEVLSEDAQLELLPGDPAKDAHVFLIHRVVMHGVGSGRSAAFEAQLTNAVPPGEIKAQGQFGPWQIDDPGQTPLSANYSFENADLSVFHGIAGVLSSTGKFGGVLQDIDVEGATTTPAFTLAFAGHPVELATAFSATVDGTNGNTILHPVIARFLNTTLLCTGSVVKATTGKGREIVLNVTTDRARLEDLLRLAVKAAQPIMTGAIRLTTKFDLPLSTGGGNVMDRLRLDGQFGVAGAEFDSPEIRDKLESLSRHGQGKPNDEDAGSAVSQLKGNFVLRNGQLTFSNLFFAVTGATVQLSGTYGLKDEKLDFRGKLRLQAKLSQMTTGAKSFLLKPFDSFFRKSGKTELPIKITGTREQPSFKLDLGGKDNDKAQSLNHLGINAEILTGTL